MSKTTIIAIVAAVVLAGAGYGVYRHGYNVGSDRTAHVYADSLQRTELRWRAFAAEQIKNGLQQVPPITLPAQVVNLSEKERVEFEKQLSYVLGAAQRDTDSLRTIITGLAEPKEFIREDIEYENALLRTVWSLYAFYAPLENRFVSHPQIKSVEVQGLPRDTIEVPIPQRQPFIDTGLKVFGGKAFKGGYGGAEGFAEIRVMDKVYIVPKLGYENIRHGFVEVGLQWR